MRQLNRFQNILFLIGGAMMVIGAGFYVFGFSHPACGFSLWAPFCSLPCRYFRHTMATAS